MLQLNYLGFAAGAFAEHRRSGIGGDAHAGELETSIQLHLRPDLVVLTPPPQARYVDAKRDYGLSQVSPDISIRTPVTVGYDLAESVPRSGVIGDPTVASPTPAPHAGRRSSMECSAYWTNTTKTEGDRVNSTVDLLPLFVKEFELCNVAEGEIVALMSTPDTRRALRRLRQRRCAAARGASRTK